MSENYTLTPTLGLFKPNYRKDSGKWGDHWNANADMLDAAFSGNFGGPYLPLEGGIMTGAVALHLGSTAITPVAGTNTTEIATTEFVQASFATTDFVSTSFLMLTGGNLSGPLKTLTVGFNGTAPIVKPTVSGSRGGNAAVAALLTALASYGLITDSTSA